MNILCILIAWTKVQDDILTFICLLLNTNTCIERHKNEEEGRECSHRSKRVLKTKEIVINIAMKAERKSIARKRPREAEETAAHLRPSHPFHLLLVLQGEAQAQSSRAVEHPAQDKRNGGVKQAYLSCSASSLSAFLALKA